MQQVLKNVIVWVCWFCTSLENFY